MPGGNAVMKLFVRADDVGGWELDKTHLLPLVDCCLENRVPLNLQVIPAWLSQESVDYLTHLVDAYGALIEIGQHGFSHDLSEFSAHCSKARQQRYLLDGRDIIRRELNLTPTVFTPPEHIYTGDTIRLLHEAGYQVISKQFKPTADGRLFYAVGKWLKRTFLFGKKISYHETVFPGTDVAELSISIETSSNFVIKGLDQMKREIVNAQKYTDIVGLLIHHECLKTDQDMNRMKSLVTYLSSEFGRNLYRFKDLLGR